MELKSEVGEKFKQLVEIIATLRRPDGCPWDREQNEKTIMNFFLEEVYELAEAVVKGEVEAVAEELGDVLMEVVFLAQIYQEKGAFSLEAVIKRINQKMVDRHPHVFGTKRATSSKKVIEEWQKRKAKEKNIKDPLQGISPETPALWQAFLLGRRAAQFGFDWPTAEEAWQKTEEELKEFKAVLPSGQETALMREAGDLFFSLVNVCRLKGINPELSLRQANEKFRTRFNQLLEELKRRGLEPGQISLEVMDSIWDEIKQAEKAAAKD